MNHTQGKLKADGALIKNQNGEMVAATIMIAATEGSQSSHEANTRRLVACRNACEGIPTEWLESVSQEITVRLFGETIQQRDELEAENERLRKAAEEAIAFLLQNAYPEDLTVIKNLRAELNKEG